MENQHNKLLFKPVELKVNYVVKPEEIQESAFQVFGITKEQMETYDRHRSVVECRHIIAYLIFKLNGLSIARISPFVGNRHRTTVDHSIKTFEDLYETDPNFANRVKHVLIRLEGLCA